MLAMATGCATFQPDEQAVWGDLRERPADPQRFDACERAAAANDGADGSGLAVADAIGSHAFGDRVRDTGDVEAPPASTCHRRWLRFGDPAVADGILLAVHGFGDHAGSMRTFGEAMAARGWAVLAYDQPGFGLREDRSRWPGEAYLLAELQLAARWLADRYPDTERHLIAKSMGAAVALLALEQDADLPVDRVVLLAPAVQSPRASWWRRSALRLFHTLGPERAFSARWVRRLDIRVTDDAEIIREIQGDRLVLRFARIESLRGVLGLMERAAVVEPTWPGPMLLVHGGRDEVIRPAAVCAWLRGGSDASAADNERRGGGARLPRDAVWLPDAYHMLTRHRGRDAVFDAVDAWLRHSPGVGTGTTWADLAAAACSAPDPRQR